MAAAALVALVHDVVVTMGVYSIIGFEVTPATVIGLLTILGFSLYDTVVVFDKVKENTRGLLGLTRRTYAEAANLALNQTLMRSINTSLIAVLPVVGLLIVGVGVLGVGTLADLALVQLVGILAGRAVVVAAGHAAAGRHQDARPPLPGAGRARAGPAAARRSVGARGAHRARPPRRARSRTFRRRRARPAAAAGAGGRGGREHPEPRRQARPRRGPRPAHRQGVEAHRQAAPVTEPEEPDLARVRDLVRDVPDFPSARRAVPRHHAGAGRRRGVHDRGHGAGDVGGRGRRRRRHRGAGLPARRGGGAGGGHGRGAGAQGGQAAAGRRVPHLRAGVRHRDAGAARGHDRGRGARVRRRRRARHGWHRRGHVRAAGRRRRRGGRASACCWSSPRSVDAIG